MLEDYDPLEVAAIMSVIALSMYKTLLDSEGFDAMINSISDSRGSVKPFKSGGMLN